MSDVLERVGRLEHDMKSLKDDQHAIRSDQRALAEETRGQTAILHRIDMAIRGDGEEKPGLRAELNAAKLSIKMIQDERTDEKADRAKLKWMVLAAVIASWGGALKAWLTGHP